MVEENITTVEFIDCPEFGMEAGWDIEVEDFPAFIMVEFDGKDFFSGLIQVKAGSACYQL